VGAGGVIQAVVLAGGAGTRLWPLSNRRRPKQFAPLIGALSLFQRTARRAQALAAGPVLVVGGQSHRDLLRAQLAEAGVEGRLLLEPLGRDSGPAVAAAALRLLAEGRDDPAVFLPSDHHIPDDEALLAALREAADAARGERLITLGLRPTRPETGYGYVQPQDEGLSLARFVEKPSAEAAPGLIASGALWNSGMLVGRPSVLVAELRRHAPELLAAVEAALHANGDDLELDPAFGAAPKISIDYALLEKSERVWVLPVDFGWSDVGGWDAVAEVLGASERAPNWIDVDSSGCFVRAAEGVIVATAGVQDLNIIAEPGAVLVTAKGSGTLIRTLAEQAEALENRPRPLREGAVRFRDWLRFRALPVWATLGVEPDGGFIDALSAAGEQVGAVRRARVQARQVFVFAAAGRLGWSGPWARLAATGLERFVQTSLRGDGLYRSRVERSGSPLDDLAALYEQAFALLALASAAECLPGRERWTSLAHELRGAVDALRHKGGGWREAGDHPFQANAQMHLLEASLAWDRIEPDAAWAALARELATLALDRFIAPSGALHEFFDADWRPLQAVEGQLIEPGHQFEWAWLLDGWGRRHGDARAVDAARRLAEVGARGFAPQLGVLADALDEDLNLASGRARLWPQAEWLRAALRLARHASGEERARWLEQAAQALHALQLYLTADGLWRDKLVGAHSFIDEPAPASSLYHIMGAYLELAENAELLGLEPDALRL